MQSLRRLIALCSPCHLVAHFGYANVQGRTDEDLAHLRKVNGLTLAEALAHVHAAEDVWIARSARVWEFDLASSPTLGSRCAVLSGRSIGPGSPIGLWCRSLARPGPATSA